MNSPHHRIVKTSEIETLRDTIRAYEAQNKFLNQEILRLNDEVADLKKKESDAQSKICELEAKCCQIQSKLLSLLKEINQSSKHLEEKQGTDQGDGKHLIANNDSVKQLVNRLLEESSLDIPLSWRPGNKSRSSSTTRSSVKDTECDELGFYYKHNHNEINGLVNRAENMRLRGDDNTDAQELKIKAAWKSRWDSYVGNLCNHPFQRSQELKSLLRTGIPQEYRCKIWKEMVHLRVKHIMVKCGPEYYESLKKQQLTGGSKSWDPAVKQIELDLLRTLPNNKHFESFDSDGTCRLRRVLLAYSMHNPSVGYCQGLNRLAAVSLLFMPEEEAFWALVAIVETIMPPDYYGQNLLGAHVDQYVLRHLLAEKLPRIHYHFDVHGIELTFFSWFLTCFVDNLPVHIYLRIWDVFLYEGNKVLFRFALAFLKYHEEEILGMNDSIVINQFISTLGEKQCDLRQLCNIAFVELNPFPYRTVKTKRLYHSNQMKQEFEKLEKLRKTVPSRNRSFDSQSDPES